MSRFLVALLVLVGAAAGAEFTDESLATVKNNLAQKNAVLVDVREKEEWDNGHVEGAVFLPLSRLRRKDFDPAELEKALPKDKTIYTHCVVGMRAKTAGKILEKHGYQVRAVKPGYEELIEAGFKPAKP